MSNQESEIYNEVGGVAYDSSGKCKILIGNKTMRKIAWLELTSEGTSDLYNLLERWLSVA